MSVAEPADGGESDAPTVERAAGGGPLVLLCDHALHHIPASLNNLGLDAGQRLSHIVWDPGALKLARRLSQLFDAALVFPGASRLVIDCNRAIDAPDSIVPVSESIAVPGNLNLSPEERERRKLAFYDPYHSAIDDLIEARLKHGRQTALIAIHTYTPKFYGETRPWHAGVIFEPGNRLGQSMYDEMSKDRDLCIGLNQPYSPGDGVFHTVGQHKDKHRLPGVMVEIRNDLLRHDAAFDQWADRLALALHASLEVVEDLVAVRSGE